ncbi:TGF beta-inducible nuclear protein [Aspergillus terreus]|nr:TGF beta-inducible nuclear protein [Aspergillus terreus]
MEILPQESSNPGKANNNKETLTAEAQWRLFKSLEILRTALLNRQLQRRWSLEQQCMKKLPIQHRIRLIMFLEPVPPFTRWSGKDDDLQRLKDRVKHLKARIEKGKELAAEIERRMKIKRITYPPNFCHTCLSTKEVLCTRCGHKQRRPIQIFTVHQHIDPQFRAHTTANMPQNEYVERWQKLHGKRFDAEERARKREARESHQKSKDAQNLRGLRAKLMQQQRHKEKIQMRKRIKAQEERNVKSSSGDAEPKSAVPHYLLDRSEATNAKALSSAIKDKRNEKAAKFSVPIPKVRGISEEEMFKVVNTGKKTHKKSWKRMITKPTFVGQDFTRQNVKYERFIRPMGLRYKKANVTHPKLGVTVQLPIINVQKNPNNPLYTRLGVLSRGTVIEVNVSELGMVTTAGKVVWAKYAQITNNPENDGCVNAVLLV